MNPLRRAQQDLAEQQHQQAQRCAHTAPTDAGTGGRDSIAAQLVRVCAQDTDLAEVAEALNTSRKHVTLWTTGQTPQSRKWAKLVQLAIERAGPVRVQQILNAPRVRQLGNTQRSAR